MVKRQQNTHTLKIRYLIGLVALLVAAGTLMGTTISVAAASSEDFSVEQHHSSDQIDERASTSALQLSSEEIARMTAASHSGRIKPYAPLNRVLGKATSSVEDLAMEQVCRIMPLGDSITRGSRSTNTVGYRQSLYLSLTGKSYTVNFVGSNSDGASATPAFDTDHEGHSGQTDDYVAANVYNWLTANPADIVLLHIGTNDMDDWRFDPGPEDVEAILDEIDRFDENITVVLARIINRQTYSPETTQFNHEIAAMAQDRIVNGDQIVIVDMENALAYPADMADDEHPNNTGYGKMANVWFNVLDNLLPGCAIPEVTLTVDEVGGGTVTTVPDSSGYRYGQVVTLTATADPGWTFAGWGGDLSSMDNPTAITLSGAHVVTATFTQNQYTLSLNTAGSGTVAGNPTQPSYVYGQVVTLTATANPAWSLASWSGDLSGTTNPATLTITGNHVVTATFEQSIYYTFLPLALNSP